MLLLDETAVILNLEEGFTVDLQDRWDLQSVYMSRERSRTLTKPSTKMSGQ